MCGLHLPPNCAGRAVTSLTVWAPATASSLDSDKITSQMSTWWHIWGTRLFVQRSCKWRKRKSLCPQMLMSFETLGALEIDFYHRLRDIWFSFRAPAAVSDSESSSKSGHSHRQNWDWNITVTCEERVKMVVSVYLLGICGHRSC